MRAVRHLDKVRFVNRVRGIRKRQVFFGGEFAPPGYDEIVHAVSVEPRYAMEQINAQHNTNYTWTSGSGNPNFGQTQARVAPYRWNNQWGFSISPTTDYGGFMFYNLPDNRIPPTMRPIYINPNHYLPTELIIWRGGLRSNSAYTIVGVYYYDIRNTPTNDPYEFHLATPEQNVSGVPRGVNITIVPFRRYLDTNTTSTMTVIAENFDIGTLASNGGDLQNLYFGYNSNNSSSNQNTSGCSFVVPFPYRNVLFSGNPPTINPHIRIAIVPVIQVTTLATSVLEAAPIGGVQVRCIATA